MILYTLRRVVISDSMSALTCGRFVISSAALYWAVTCFTTSSTAG